GSPGPGGAGNKRRCLRGRLRVLRCRCRRPERSRRAPRPLTTTNTSFESWMAFPEDYDMAHGKEPKNFREGARIPKCVLFRYCPTGAKQIGYLGISLPFSRVMPLCFAWAANLREEAHPCTPENIQDCIRRERECPDFTKWYDGFSPKDHFEMIQLREMRA